MEIVLFIDLKFNYYSIELQQYNIYIQHGKWKGALKQSAQYGKTRTTEQE